MEESWDSHVAPLIMGVGCTELQDAGSVQGPNQDLGHLGQQDVHQVQDLHRDMHHADMTHDLSQDMHNDFFGSNQLLVSGQPTTGATSSSPASGGGSLSPGGGSALSPGGGSSSGAGGGGGCCESGRPLVTDPVTGQSVCSCQYDTARLALSQYPRSVGVGVGVYGAPYPSTDQNPYPSIGVDSSAFYSPLSNPYALKEAGGAAADMSAWTSAGLQPTTGYYPYDPTLAAYGLGSPYLQGPPELRGFAEPIYATGYVDVEQMLNERYGAGYDLAARRKNATRESTATLKAWLNEHKKNPYPTKGEKIMLAIITKMTLTQVSTWFANARRRLKKENKMTWEPKNKTDDDDDAMVSDSDEKDKDDLEDKREETDIHGRVKSERSVKDMEDDELTDDERKDELLGGHMHHMLGGGFGMKPEMKTTDCGVPLPASKPKIWSLADTAACKTPPPPPPTHQQQWLGSQGFALPSAAAARYGGGGFLPGHCQQGFPDVQTDTPPQTPPSMKLPSVAGNLLPAAAPCNPATSAGAPGYPQPGQAFLGGFGRLQSPQRPPPPAAQQPPPPPQHMPQPVTDNAAFKPFYKSPQPMSGGFVSPV